MAGAHTPLFGYTIASPCASRLPRLVFTGTCPATDQRRRRLLHPNAVTAEMPSLAGPSSRALLAPLSAARKRELSVEQFRELVGIASLHQTSGMSAAAAHGPLAARVPFASRTPVRRIVLPGLMMPVPVDRLRGSRSALADCVTINEMPAVVEAGLAVSKRAIGALPLKQELEL